MHKSIKLTDAIWLLLVVMSSPLIHALGDLSQSPTGIQTRVPSLRGWRLTKWAIPPLIVQVCVSVIIQVIFWAVPIAKTLWINNGIVSWVWWLSQVTSTVYPVVMSLHTVVMSLHIVVISLHTVTLLMYFFQYLTVHRSKRPFSFLKHMFYLSLKSVFYLFEKKCFILCENLLIM